MYMYSENEWRAHALVHALVHTLSCTHYYNSAHDVFTGTLHNPSPSYKVIVTHRVRVYTVNKPWFQLDRNNDGAFVQVTS